MNKFTLALALGTGLTLGLAAPSAHADPMHPDARRRRTISAASSTACSQPISDAPVHASTFQFDGGDPTSGVMQSQVFQGTGAAAGLYAYAYQVGVNNVNDSDGNAGRTSTSASCKFNATPVGTDFLNRADHVVRLRRSTDGPVGGLTCRRPRRPDGPAPVVVAWQPGTNGRLARGHRTSTRPTTSRRSAPGGNSATFVVLSNQPFAQQLRQRRRAPTRRPARLTHGLRAPTARLDRSRSPVPEPTTSWPGPGWPGPSPWSAGSARPAPPSPEPHPSRPRAPRRGSSASR